MRAQPVAGPVLADPTISEPRGAAIALGVAIQRAGDFDLMVEMLLQFGFADAFDVIHRRQADA